MSLRAVNWAPPTSLKEVPYVTLATNSKRKSNEIKKKKEKRKMGTLRKPPPLTIHHDAVNRILFRLEH